MPEEISIEMDKELFGTQSDIRREKFSPLPDALRPSRKGLEPYIPKPELWNVAYRDGADLPHHGVLHGEETAILTALNTVAMEIPVKPSY